MARPAKPSSIRGLLIVEAALSAVIIATGLVFISRGLAGQLRALRACETSETLVSLAQSKLRELEAKKLSDQKLADQDRAGTFEEPYQQYEWAMTAMVREEPKDAQGGLPMAKDVVIQVGPSGHVKQGVSLSAIWPKGWIPDSWPSQ